SFIPQGSLWAQGTARPVTGSLLGETGIIITIILLLIPILFAIIFLVIRVANTLNQTKNQWNQEEAEKLAAYLRSLPDEEINTALKKRKAALDFQLNHQELSGNQPADDKRGLQQINSQTGLPIVALKKKA